MARKCATLNIATELKTYYIYNYDNNTYIEPYLKIL